MDSSNTFPVPAWFVTPLDARKYPIGEALHFNSVDDFSEEWDEDELDGDISWLRFDWEPEWVTSEEAADMVPGDHNPDHLAANLLMAIPSGKVRIMS